MNRPHELSAGAVVFRLAQGRPFYLLLHYPPLNSAGGEALRKKSRNEKKGRLKAVRQPDGHWDFPKGHVENKESISAAAGREIREETGLEKINFLPGFEEKISYWYQRAGRRWHKEVIFLLAEADQKKIRLSPEHIGFAWLAYPEARERVSFDQPRTILEKAHRYLTEKTLPLSGR